ncbi:hypothetical protein B5C34_14855 [Pacificimonas flava]|uniref:GGDEF domain-containing protein n=2 Tax=Pacificimonas TaxID=1960290 RepID=A0A219B0D2_9SPHN|nr:MULTISPECIES: diguanylate cyclase [Pacificimonas]MBZ6379757.1 diguanylate cyclase [Pacificimonas aurantium]OWV31787.1 hypothetical protein B5C34_14855 [Pacificimonas flava]
MPTAESITGTDRTPADRTPAGRKAAARTTAARPPIPDRLSAPFRAPFRTDVPPAIADELALRQSERLYAFLPLLCILVAANSLVMAYAIMGDLPWWQQAAPPVILTCTCLTVLVLSRVRPRPKTAEAARRQHRTAAWIAGGLGLVSAAWCINAFSETEEYYCMTAPVFTGIAAIIASTCLLSVPRAAIAGMVCALLPVTAMLLTYEYASLRAMALMLMLLTLMQAGVVMGKFRETVAALMLETRLDRLAKADALTGLDNRLAFEAKAEAELERGAALRLVLADLDGFKLVNDTHGHQAGDAVLIMLAARMRAAAPGALSIARIGGDEFALLLPAGDAPRAEAEIAALSAAIRPPVVHEGRRLHVGASFGAASSPEDGQTVAKLLHAADMRLYERKPGSRGEARAPLRHAALA